MVRNVQALGGFPLQFLCAVLQFNHANTTGVASFFRAQNRQANAGVCRAKTRIRLNISALIENNKRGFFSVICYS